MLTRPVLLWDGGCGFCEQWVRRVERWDRHGKIETLTATDRSKYPSLLLISDQQLDHAMHLALPDGRILAGGRAVPEILQLLPRGRWIAWVFRLPGFARATERVYSWVAARRHRLGCAIS